MKRHQGTPQGGPPSRLLANILLDEVDREQEQEQEPRGHHFARYTDDCSAYVRSYQAGKRCR